MDRYRFLSCGLILFFCGLNGYASVCPDPQNSSLQWGIPPGPWVVNPYSAHAPQGHESTRFARANILVAGYGQGVLCSYKSAAGDYSIWWQVRTKIPAPGDYSWINTLGGFICTQGIDACNFSVAE